jgi:hypothetical protein
MSHHAVDSGIDYRLLSFFLMPHHRRRESILSRGEGDDPPTRNK